MRKHSEAKREDVEVKSWKINKGLYTPQEFNIHHTTLNKTE